MSGKMEMSLDDIIKQNKGSKRPGGSSRRGGRGAGGGGRSSGSPRRGGSIRGGRKPGGGVMRGRSRGGISRSSSFGRSMPSYKREAFLGSAAPRRYGSSSDAFLGSSGSRRYGSSSDTTKLIVSNLDFGVTDSDILELFSEFGPLKHAGVHYDRSGRSLGSADLIFERRSDAIKAMKQYNGVPLDGREMNIQLATSEIPGSNPIRGGPRLSNSGPFRRRGSMSSRSRPRGAGGRTRGGPKRGDKPGGGPRGKRPPPPTAEELDAQLEEYVKSKVSNSEGA